MDSRNEAMNIKITIILYSSAIILFRAQEQVTQREYESNYYPNKFDFVLYLLDDEIWNF